MANSNIGKQFMPKSYFCISSCLMILLMTHLSDPKVTNEQFSLVKETECSVGLVEAVDKYRIEGTLNLTQKKASQMSVTYETELQDGVKKTECFLDLEKECVQGVRTGIVGCYCQKLSHDQLIVILRLVADQRDSNSTIIVTWETMNLVQVPPIYKPNSKGYGYIQGALASRYSTPCQFAVSEDDVFVKYCCQYTAEPCTATIKYKGQEPAHGNPCAIFLKSLIDNYSEPFIFSHTICGQPGANYSCTATKAIEIPVKDTRTTSKFLTGALLGVAFIVGLIHFGTAAAMYYRAKSKIADD